jgi:hypothetical protein
MSLDEAEEHVSIVYLRDRLPHLCGRLFDVSNAIVELDSIRGNRKQSLVDG